MKEYINNNENNHMTSLWTAIRKSEDKEFLEN
jgi:hypothetical protein